MASERETAASSGAPAPEDVTSLRVRLAELEDRVRESQEARDEAEARAGRLLERAREAREGAEDSERRVRALLDTAREGIWKFDTEGRTIYANARMEAILHESADALIGRPMSDWLDEDARATVAMRLPPGAGRPGDAFDVRFHRRDGSEGWASASVGPLESPPGVLLMLEDVTERVWAQRALRESEARARAVFEANVIGIVFVDTDGRIAEANDRFLALIGADRDLLEQGRLSWTGLTPREFRPRDARALEVMRQWGLHVPYEKDLRRVSDGVRVPVRVGAVLLAGPPGLIVAFVLDLTEERRAQAALEEHAATLEQRVRERTAALEEMNEQLAAFTSTVSHDLRAPLRAVRGFGEALLEDHERLDPVALGYAERMMAAARQMDTLIIDLLAYSRMSQIELTREPVELRPLVWDALAPLEPEIAEKHARVEVDETMPTVVGHRPVLMQVIANLVVNALKFVAHGKTPVVRIRSEHRGDTARLWVEDEGIGIAPDYHERIFRVFERLHPAERFPGTGIGLAMVRKAMERQGGSAGVVSALGQGSRFWIELPTAFSRA